MLGTAALVLVMAAAMAGAVGAEEIALPPPLTSDAAEPPPAAALPPPVAVLRALNKITARVTTLQAPVDQPVAFGALTIVARTCVKTPPEEPPEAGAFLEISDRRGAETPRRIFSGWMFASNPALSALEHPIYDLWVLDCETNAEATAAMPSADIPPGNDTRR